LNSKKGDDKLKGDGKRKLEMENPNKVNHNLEHESATDFKSNSILK